MAALAEIRAAARALTSEYRAWISADRGHKDSEAEHLIVSTLQDSIQYRSQAVGYHLQMLYDTLDTALATHRADPHRKNSRYLLRDAALQLQFLFDDLVFNIISLFDYIGCMVGLILEGAGSHKIDWRKAVGKTKGPSTRYGILAVVSEAHKTFVGSLLRYRSEISHFRRDEVDGHISVDLLGKGGDNLHITVPRWFTQIVRVNAPIGTPGEDGEAITDIATVLAQDTGIIATRVLTALRAYVAGLDYAAPATTAEMYARRWSRAGLWEKLSADPRLFNAGVDHVGALYTNTELYAVVILTNDRRVDVGPLDLPFENGASPEAVIDALADRIVEHLDK